MSQVLYSVIRLVGLWIMGGLLGGSMLLGLSHLSDGLFKKTGLPLKYQALAPPLILVLIGLFTSPVFVPYALILYGFGVLLLCLGREYFFGRPVIRQLIGVSLMATVALPFMLIALYVVTDFLGPGYYSFIIHNHSGYEIVLKEVQVNGQVIFPREHSHDGRPEIVLPPDPKARPEHVAADLKRRPKKVTMRVYDARRQKEIQEEVSLPRSEKHPVCGFDIVYEPDGFRYDDSICVW